MNALREDLIHVTGGEVDRAIVSLRFFGDALEPERISDLLQCQPSFAHRKGDEIVGKRSNVRRIAKTGAWIIKSERKKDSLEEQIHSLLNCVASDPAVWDELKAFSADLFCGLFLDDWSSGFELSPGLLKRVSERGLTLDFDIYSFREDTDAVYGSLE